MNIFEAASRKGLTFPSDRGLLTTDQLWHLSLPALDKVARKVNADLKGVTEESFVATVVNPNKATYELQLEVAKHIIAAKLAEAEDRKTAAAKAERRRKLTEALDAKEDEELGNKSREELAAEIAALG
jgi:membrane glycosyltransferase